MTPESVGKLAFVCMGALLVGGGLYPILGLHAALISVGVSFWIAAHGDM